MFSWEIFLSVLAALFVWWLVTGFIKVIFEDNVGTANIKLEKIGYSLDMILDRLK